MSSLLAEWASSPTLKPLPRSAWRISKPSSSGRRYTRKRFRSRPPIQIAGTDDLRQELAALRDTSTQFDMSFDAALQRLEARVRHLEGRHVSPETQHSVLGPADRS